METTTTKRQRNASNIIKFHYLTKLGGNGELVGLRGYSHHDEGDRYDLHMLPDGTWEVHFCYWTNSSGVSGLEEPHYRLLKQGTVLECMEAAELYDEEIALSLDDEDNDDSGEWG